MRLVRAADAPGVFRVCFVCTGNICRSPMAETILLDMARSAGLDHSIGIMSAGTGDWHVGEPADHRTLQALANHGYDGSFHRAKQFDPDWFEDLDLVVTFDRTQERVLRAWARSEEDAAKIQPLLGFDSEQSGVLDVPDPYYSDAAQFDRVLVMIERACTALFAQIRPGIARGA